MLKVENVEVYGFEAAIRGARNPMNSWDRMDSEFYITKLRNNCKIGPNDYKMLKNLTLAGPEHRKWNRMVTVTMDITAPMYWFSEYDTYKIATTANSTSKMHKMLAKPFEMSDFSFDRLIGYKNEVKQFIPPVDELNEEWKGIQYGYKISNQGRVKKPQGRILGYADKVNIYEEVARPIVDTLNELRDMWFNCDDEVIKKQIWYNILQLLPNSYNQKRTVHLNYETLGAMYRQRRHHKLDEWHVFCDTLEKLPYSEFITMKFEEVE